jgi:hypothetical protein
MIKLKNTLQNVMLIIQTNIPMKYIVFQGTKGLAEAQKDGMILYVRKSHYPVPSDGSGKEFSELRDGYLENTIDKNNLMRAYFPHAHFY